MKRVVMFAGIYAIVCLLGCANAKDATEAAVASFFGNTTCTYMSVQCTAFEEPFVPFIPAYDKIVALSYQ